jgi:hypothetical protein
MDKKAYFDKHYIKNPNIVFRKIAGECILVPIKQRASEVDSIYNINEVGSFIWEHMDGEKPLSEIRDIIVNEFEVASETAGADLLEFLQQLEKIGAVKAI